MYKVIIELCNYVFILYHRHVASVGFSCLEASWRRFRCRRDARNSQRELFDKRLADIQTAT